MIFSALDANIAGACSFFVARVRVLVLKTPLDDLHVNISMPRTGEVEDKFAAAGFAVFSNAKNHRYDPDVPILIPHANANHLDVITHQVRACVMLLCVRMSRLDG